MELLNAALAFTVVMLIFSTIVAAAVEIVQQCLKLRQHVFREMIARVFDEALWPLAADRLDPARKKAIRDSFIEALTVNEGAPPSQGATGVARFGIPDRIRTLNAMEFLERLARTDIGAALLDETEERLKAITYDLARRFEAAGEGARAFYAARSRLFSVGIAVMIAFGANVDTVRVFKALHVDQALSEQLIDQGAQVVADLQAQEKRVAASLAALEAGGTAPEETRRALAELRATLETRMTAAEKRVTGLAAVGLPIGHEYFPYCMPGDSGCIDIDGRGTWGWVAWFLSTLMAGFLIGLGGPFWYRVFTGLSQIRDLLRGLGAGRRRGDAAEGSEGGGADSAAEAARARRAPPPRDPLDAFLTAARARPAAGTAATTANRD